MRVKSWTFLGLTALAGFCLAPDDCEQAPADSDAEAPAAEVDARAATRVRNATLDCKARAVCAAANSQAFSQTECENNNAIDGERADSLDCGDAFDAFLACAATLSYDCTQPIDAQLINGCNSQYSSYVSCN